MYVLLYVNMSRSVRKPWKVWNRRHLECSVTCILHVFPSVLTFIAVYSCLGKQDIPLVCVGVSARWAGDRGCEFHSMQLSFFPWLYLLAYLCLLYMYIQYLYITSHLHSYKIDYLSSLCTNPYWMHCLLFCIQNSWESTVQPYKHTYVRIFQQLEPQHS